MDNHFLITSRYLSISDDLLLKTLLAWGNQPGTGWRYCTEAERSDAVIIDLDSKQGRWEWGILEQSNESPLRIAYTKHPERYPDVTYVIPKPARAGIMKNILDTACSQLSGKKIPAKYKILNSPETSNTRARIIDLLLQHRQKVVLIESNKLRMILDCSNHKCYGHLTYADLLILLQTPCSEYAIKILDQEQKHRYNQNLPVTDLAQAVWTVTMSETMNNALPACPYDAHLHLQTWPDFKTLPHLPVHIAVAACLARNSDTPRRLAQATHTSIEKIQPFINACLALGYMATSKEPKLFWQDVEQSNMSRQRSSLMGKLSKRWTQNSVIEPQTAVNL